MSEPLRVAIAGYGLAGEVFHAPLVAATASMRVAAISTTDPDRRARAAAAFPQAELVDDIRSTFARVDLLVVATPNRAHVPLALAALAQGVAVVVDKPLASTAAQAAPLLAHRDRVTVFQSRRLDGDYLTVKRLLDDGTLGQVIRMESRFERFRPQVDPQAWRELADPGDGGGLLLDLGAHLVDQAIQLLGPPRRIYAEIDVRRPGAQVDDDVFVALEHDGGARSHLRMSATAPLHGPRLALSGLRAGVSIDGLDPQEDQLAAGLRPGDAGWGSAPGRRATIADADGRREIAVEPGAYEHYYAAVGAWLREGAPAPVDLTENIAMLTVLDAARTAARTRSIIEMETT